MNIRVLASRIMVRAVLVTLLAAGAASAAMTECRGGQFGFAPAPDDLTGFELAQRLPKLAAAHARLPGLPGWARTWEGPMSPARRLVAPDGQVYLVLDTCEPHDCGNNAFYGVWVPASGAYAAVVLKLRTWVDAGKMDDGMRVAIACALAADQREAALVRAYLQAHPVRAPWEH